VSAPLSKFFFFSRVSFLFFSRPRDLREKANRFRSLFSLSVSLVARDAAVGARLKT
jgi:hypothetical protein